MFAVVLVWSYKKPVSLPIGDRCHLTPPVVLSLWAGLLILFFRSVLRSVCSSPAPNGKPRKELHV